ncbi:unnamed protein product (macronuclear) [Paramecium tetraurelia]|uniref:CHHC U11-48K-type domain-containing protein n=1 Tax=Paramecium tetraurelia TaxID=5888 RepID=A0CDB5_PARTE|nr:uncharacterized protein GSPATT00006993001 [Paramecium tetraurelia]CAK68782.1 unnamed protein product [Paramecium tetraurelia]|eukprot:XP_001436179.1 hypothetical protein (macronuclear) [Paramecium tetraurelia strain d4-2]
MKKAHKYKKKNLEVCCPYNPNHLMPFSQLWFHLSSGCEDKQKFGHLYQICPYNSLHILQKEHYEDHIKNCQKKIDVDDDLLKQMSNVAQEQFVEENQFQDQFISRNCNNKYKKYY